MHKNIIKVLSIAVIFTIFSGCGGDGAVKFNNSSDNNSSVNVSQDPYAYKGLQFYYENLEPSSYKLEQLSDSEFNSLSKIKRLQVANNLLESLFFGYEFKDLEAKIDSGTFISDIRDALNEDRIDRGELESYIANSDNFRQFKDKSWAKPQVLTILTRFYAMKKLDRYYLANYIAYILTQTIMFSPAYELSSTHTPDIARVYNRLVNMLDINSGMRYITYVHMMSEENWRRFRSPEDNGREMLEIFLLDTKDSHVPLAAKALQNWRLNTNSDTLEVSLNKNTTPIKLFGTTIYTGEDFYRELVKSDEFTYGVTKRLVDFYFPLKSEVKKEQIAKTIASSNPQKWEDIILQIIFSKEYLLSNKRALSAEELFYSMSKKLKFRVKRDGIYYFRGQLSSMHQASMKYKLGKLERVPLDLLSFATYHKFIREYLFLNSAELEESNKDSWRYDGWSEEILNTDNFNLDTTSHEAALKSFIKYLFLATIAKEPNESEYNLFISHMLENGELKYEFNILANGDNQDEVRLDRRKNVARIVFDYISRLETTYMQKEVK